jgi:type I restriction enzyme S subunit
MRLTKTQLIKKLKSMTLYQIKKGQFIYSRLFAFEGGYALVPPEFDGYYVSNEFPTFDIDLEKATSKFLITLFLTEQDWQELAMSSKGVGDRRLRIQPEKILHRKIWLPPLKEQERIEKMFDAYQALKDKHAVIRAANRALIPATLERVFQ